MDYETGTNTVPGSAFFANNIFSGTSTDSTIINTGYNIGTYCLSNIIGNVAGTSYSYYATGITGGASIADFATYIDLGTVTGSSAGEGYHALLKLNQTSPAHPIIGKVNNLDDIGSRVWDTEGFSHLSSDQLGQVRPVSRSIGAIDVNGFQVQNGDVRVYYDSSEPAPGNVPKDTIINLSGYVLNNPTTAITYTLVGSTTLTDCGTVSLSGSNATFHPLQTKPANGYKEGSFTFRVSGNDSNGRPHEETATVRIQVLDLKLDEVTLGSLPGYDGALDVQCKIDMKPVDFDPRYKFITGAFTNSTIGGNNYDNITVSNTTEYQVYDYHIPLVGDLNHDGKPEIVALGMNTTSTDAATGFAVKVNRIHIFDGQDGTQLGSYPIPEFKPYGNSTIADATVGRGTYDGYHGSPGCMALVDSEGNGTINVILATSNATDAGSSKKLISYNIFPSGNTFTLTQKWEVNYYSDNDGTNAKFSTPIIQIVDFDGNGTPEILVYNKIFDARNGVKLLEYETLNDDPETTGSAYVGRDFKGRETWSKDQPGNSKIGFASVYDIDKDGKYDICAGGKVYYDIDFGNYTGNGTYKIFDIMTSGILPDTERAWLAGNTVTEPSVDKIRKFTDARTAVADIDGDGIPEIVASYYVQSNFHYDKGASTNSSTNGGESHDHGSENKLRIVAWNAHLDKSGTGTSPGASTATLKAILNIPLSNYATTGTYSYMYIADVDGREQNGQKLPEISILGPMFYCYMYGSAWAGYPIHPNVADSMAVSYPRTGGPLVADKDNRAKGSLISFTWDNTPGISVFDRLKVSFMMEHKDESVNTGISLFDFDNDGINEICYRDEQNLRIIRPIRPFVSYSEGESQTSDVILFRKPVKSNTGFEYPVIVDLDGDYSGDMLVSGSEQNSTNTFLYAVQGANADLAPARTVWNQFMYSPLKINDDLKVPQPVPPHPLSPATAFFKDAGDSYETPIYNMNIGQVPYFSITDGTGLFAPLVKTPDAEIKNPKFNGAENEFPYGSIEFVIANKSNGEAAINVNTPIKVYTSETPSSYLDIYKDTIVGSAVYPGNEVTIKVPLKAAGDNGKTFIIRVSDDSFDVIPGSGGQRKGDLFGTDESSYADCTWGDNRAFLSYFYLPADYYTLLPNETAVLDILGNDILTLHSTVTIDSFDITPGIPVVNQKLQYTAPSTGGLYEYTYQYKFDNTLPVGHIYVYVAELEDPNTLLCDGQPYTLKVKELPAGVGLEIKYYDSNLDPIVGDHYDFTADASLRPVEIFYVQPIFTHVPGYEFIKEEFLPKRIDYKVITTTIKMEWTGLAGHDWHNPANWVEVGTDGKKTSVNYIPNTCVDVVIPAGLGKDMLYPLLHYSTGGEAYCNSIKLGDRAMIAGIHLLNYVTAEVEFKLNADERDRFVMWSAPMKSVYSGDYHFKDGTTPKFGDVYMNLFQHPSPDGSSTVGVANSFTATFRKLNEPLGLGKAFNLKVTNTTVNSGKPFTFPQAATTYTDVDNITTPAFSRANSSKFILDKLDGNPYNNLQVANDVAGSKLVQVVNPYMAYLSVATFLSNNSSQLSASGYVIWDGSSNSFVSRTVAGDIDNRFEITTDPLPMTSYWSVPPLQSFFVQKATAVGTALISPLTIDATWTTTDVANPYKLRAGAPETNVLRIKATQDGGRVSYAVLHYNESTSPAYNSSEDMDKLFYQLEEDIIPLEVYTFAPTREVLAINSSSDFSQDVPLGLRTDKTGSVTLEFSGMATFGHNVYLKDHVLNKETNLQTNPVYTFTVAKKSASDKVIELNDRFSLRTDYTGIGLDNETIGTTGLNVSSGDGYIYVQTSSPAASLQVYSATGALVYSSAATSDYFRIQTDRQQAYIVKVKIKDDYLTQKVFVK
jgi:hypothetical protein